MEGVEERVKSMVMEQRKVGSESLVKDDEELMKGIEIVLQARRAK